MLARWLKQQVMGGYDQLRVRKNLYHLRDRRSMTLRLDKTLMAGALIWPEYLPSKPRTIIDVGAHCGEVAGQLATLYAPTFVALVEPLPQMAEVLRSSSFARQQRVFACALGRMVGTAQLNVLASAPSTSLLHVAPGCDEIFHRPMDVPSHRRANANTGYRDDECGLEELDLLKVDVQGYEARSFAGGNETLHQTRVIVCEVSFFEHYVGQPLFPVIYSYLTEHGYGLHGTFGFSYDDRGRPLQCDAVFVNLSKLWKKAICPTLA